MSPIVGEEGVSSEGMKKGVSLSIGHIMKDVFDGEIGLGSLLEVQWGGGIFIVIVCVSYVIIRVCAIK